MLLVFEPVTGRYFRFHFRFCSKRRRGHRTCGWHRPVAEQAKAVFGNVEDMFQTAAMFARGFEVILECRQRIGQVIHLRTTGYASIFQQFITDETTHALGQFGRARRRQHAHCAGNFVHQRAVHRRDGVLPAGFDEGNDRVLYLAGIADRFLHQGGDDAQRLAARQTVHGIVGTRLILGAQALDVVVQRRLDVQQRTGHIEQVSSSAGACDWRSRRARDAVR